MRHLTTIRRALVSIAAVACVALGFGGEAQAAPTTFTFTSGDVNVELTDDPSGQLLGSERFLFGGDSIILDIDNIGDVVDILTLKMSIVPDSIAVAGLGSVDVLMAELTGIAPPVFLTGGGGVWNFGILADIEALVDFGGQTELVASQELVTGTLNLTNPGMLDVRVDGSTFGVFTSPFVDPPAVGASVRMDANNIKWIGAEAPVPEPGATALYALGLFIVSRARSRRRSAQPA